MKRIILIAAMGLLALQAAAGEPWQNGFSVGVEGNFSLANYESMSKDVAFNDFWGTTVSGSYTAFHWKGLFVRPELSMYYERHAIEMLLGGSYADRDHVAEMGFGIALFGGYRVPLGAKTSFDLLTGPYYTIAVNQHETNGDDHEFNLYNKSSLRWRFGVGLNVRRLTIGASFDLGLLKIGGFSSSHSDDRESNVVSVGIGYNF